MQEEVYKVIDDYLLWLKDNSGRAPIHKIKHIDSKVKTNAILLMKKYELIHYKHPDESKSLIEITLNGEKSIDVGGIKNYIEEYENKHIKSSIHIGHNIQGNVIHSDLSQGNSLNKEVKTINPPNKTSRNPTIEKWGLWVAIIVGLATILASLKTCGIIK